MTETHLLPIAQRGEPILQQRAQEVTGLHDPVLQQLIDAMQATMLAANGVGIAAPQVFVSKRVIIVASRPNPRYPDAPSMQPLAMINPEILWRSAATCLSEEGCLSVPDVRAPIERAERIQVRYLTRAGETREAEYSGFIARIIQHECDHLDGILFVERVMDDTQEPTRD
ncbi:MAG: peptide deformylase [Candidatus Thiothrix singaporensis]|uniref:Peptide deformylase n=1 Tax=Candidatus Thiothrix singaporensis TaxID=2799669 RepID=A0A7L6AUB6_9GAMM|nr:MAG: peptide deformylase [Candidatus Thiothrix singaporensis]